MNTPKNTILICDSDVNLSMVLADYMRSQDFVVDVVNTGTEVIEKVNNSHYDLLIMEVVIPKTNGYQILTSLRDTKNDIPVIFLTEKDSRENIIRAFELGCDDYVIKPFSMDILICRIRAILRRLHVNDNVETKFELDGKEYDSIQQVFDGKHLSSKENDLLLILVRNKNQVVSRYILLSTVWQKDDYFTSRSLSVYINHLRNILKDTSLSIIGVHGKGYKMIDKVS